jgi:c-di-GMP-binding flagellar brake protein YcgR
LLQTLKKLEKLFTCIQIIDIELFIGEKSIPIRSRIMRKFKNEDNVFYGLIFLDIDENDFEDLFYLVYGRKVTNEMLKNGKAVQLLPR